MKIKIFFLAVLLTTALFSISAESYWEGAASMSRYGEFPVKGFYGASNSFPLNSIVEVNNPANGKKVEIIIVNSLEDNNLFILLSKDAAEKISMKEDDIITVKASIVKKHEAAEEREKALTDDPDLNPAKAVLFPESEEDKSEMYEDETENLKEEKVETVRRERDLADEIIETLIISDIPEKVPEEPEKAEKTEEPEEEVEITAIIVPDDEEKEEVFAEPLTEESITGEDELFEKYNPDAAAEEKDETPAMSGDYEEKLVLVPSEPKPPENGKTAYKEAAEDKAVPETADFRKYTSSASPVSSLDSNSYYLQIGAYKDFESADKLAGRINIDYPVFLYKKGENGIYRVMAGPLRNDEKGAALYQVRIKGITDAFIKKGE